MAAFASCRRSGWVRLLVVILCAFFIFAMLGAPAAQALGVESVAVFGLASVLSAATAALGFKLASNEQGQVTLQKMVQDFKTVAWATGFVLVGSKLNGLQNGMDYIKMQVQNGKTYLDSRVFAWVQKWLAQNGVYSKNELTIEADSQSKLNSLGIYYDVFPERPIGNTFSSDSAPFFSSPTISVDQMLSFWGLESFPDFVVQNWDKYHYICGLSGTTGIVVASCQNNKAFSTVFYTVDGVSRKFLYWPNSGVQITYDKGKTWNYAKYEGMKALWTIDGKSMVIWGLCNFLPYSISGNDTGLTGTDTLGKDVIDLTLDQILQRLKEWAQDWFDAGADSATNAATGAQDLPLTVATGAATANPSIAEDGPLVWFPSFGVPIPTLRTGETDTKTVDQGKENASAVETSTVDVAENQSVIDSLVNWALSYISPDTGLFSKFPLCVPYDAYLLVTSSLGVDAVGSDSIFGASPGDLDGVVTEGIETYSDFQPIINIKHDFELDGVTYPLELVIDLRPWQPLVTFFREGMALLLVAELIGAEFKRIRWH